MTLSLGRYPGSDIEFYSLEDLLNSESTLPNGVPIRWIDSNGEVQTFIKQDGVLQPNPRYNILDFSDISEDTMGYTIELGASGISRDVDGNLVLLADDTNPEVRISFGDLFPPLFLHEKVNISLGVSATNPDIVGNYWERTRCGFEVFAEGAADNPINELGLCCITVAAATTYGYSKDDIGSTNTAGYGTLPFADIKWFDLNLNIFSAQYHEGLFLGAGAGNALGSTPPTTYLGVARASIISNYSGFNFSSNPDQKSSFEFFVNQGSTGSSLEVTLKQIKVVPVFATQL